MPLPWKKDKVSRFSRIVADLQSPKGGSSLVVETGFPTSLVDLFVKNRERLKKPTGKKKKKRQQQLQDVEEELVISDPIFISSSLELAGFHLLLLLLPLVLLLHPCLLALRFGFAFKNHQLGSILFLWLQLLRGHPRLF